VADSIISNAPSEAVDDELSRAWPPVAVRCPANIQYHQPDPIMMMGD
jgi:hypothetical protein